MTRSPTFWFVVAIAAVAIAFWLALQVLGILMKLILLVVAVVVAVAALSAWLEARRA